MCDVWFSYNVVKVHTCTKNDILFHPIMQRLKLVAFVFSIERIGSFRMNY